MKPELAEATSPCKDVGELFQASRQRKSTCKGPEVAMIVMIRGAAGEASEVGAEELKGRTRGEKV